MMLRKRGEIGGATDGVCCTESPTTGQTFSRTRSQHPVGIFSLMFAVVLLAHGGFVDAEINEEYGVFKIQQKAACPTVFCPWNCERYIDNNGCLFCGKCLPQSQCPQVSCPSLPYFQCLPRQGRDGCTVCKCRVRSRPPYDGATAALPVANVTTTTSRSAALISAPTRPPPPPPAPQAAIEPPRPPQQPSPSLMETVAPSVAGADKRPPCMSTPMCSQNCRIENDVNGCPRCKCFPRRDCPEPPNAPCRRPDCQRLLGADGCYHCQCPDDVAVCREVKCFKPCTPLIDWSSGCATGCRCPNDAKNRK